MHETYHMNLHDRELDNLQVEDVLARGRYAVIAMCQNNEPYVVTLSYGYDATENVLYFHSAPTGLKLDIIGENPNVCATVIEDRGYREGKCAHAYRSVVLSGQMVLIEDAQEKIQGMKCMLHHLEPYPEAMEERLLTREKFLTGTAMLKLVIGQKRGKAGQ